MIYTKGRAGPESRTRLTITDVIHTGTGSTSMARGNAVADLKKGPRRVSFLVQGRHYTTFKAQLQRDGELDAMVRWTGREAVTITGAPAGN